MKFLSLFSILVIVSSSWSYCAEQDNPLIGDGKTDEAEYVILKKEAPHDPGTEQTPSAGAAATNTTTQQLGAGAVDIVEKTTRPLTPDAQTHDEEEHGDLAQLGAGHAHNDSNFPRTFLLATPPVQSPFVRLIMACLSRCRTKGE